ncbi:NB-ARC domain-containing protein [Streptomyces mayteni]
MTGASALVGLMVSESWERARERVGQFLARRRSASDPDPEAQLQAARDELERGRRAAADVEAEWRRRLFEVFRGDPGAAVELRRMLVELAPGGSVAVVSGGTHHGPAFHGAHIQGDITFQVPAALPVGTDVRPDQVPALTGPFSNRVAELAWLDQAVSGGGIEIGVVGGPPGVGKKALTRRWAERARDRFPDGQLHVDFAAPGTDTAEALATVLRSLQVGDEYIPRSLAERARLFRSRSAGRRVLVVLDDVSEPAQVRPLVPKGAGSVVLVTSQRRLAELTLDGARLISLKPLDAEGGLALLRDCRGADAVAAEPAAAERLVTLCGGLPVALRIVAARLLVDEGLTMASLAAELEDEQQRLVAMSLPGEGASVSTVFESAYRRLPPEVARLYRLLGWLPTPTFDAGVAAAAAGVDTARARRLLGSLAANSLVETGADGRYRMQDLVRLHARERAAAEEPAADQAALTERVATHYLVLTAFADRALRAGRLRIATLGELLSAAENPFAAAGGPSPLEWLDAERHAILGVLRVAARHGFHALVWPLSEAFTALFLHRRRLEPWRESLELGAESAAAAATVARTAGEIAEATAAEARLRSLLSRPLLDLGEDDRAREEIEAAVSRAEVTDHLVLRASVQEFYGRYLDRFDPPRAVTAYRRSLDLNEQAGERRGAAIAGYFLGRAQDALGDHAAALDTLRGAHADLLDLAEPDRRMAARVMAAVGVAHDHLGDDAEAIRALSAAVTVLREVDATHYEAQALEALVDVAARGDAPRERVRDWLTRALEIHERNGSPEADRLRRRLADET